MSLAHFTQTVFSVDPNIDGDIVRLMALELHARYTEPQRHYHTLEHISHMLDALKPGTAHKTIKLAIWFHDCVYDPVKGGPWNERESIRIWERFADSTQSRAMAELKEPVSALVEMTISHRIPEALPMCLKESDVAVFHDLDMGILADSPTSYDKYALAIRKEYSHYPDADYRLGRTKVLQNFLSRERIFLGQDTETMEQQARKNIQGELERLAEQET